MMAMARRNDYDNTKRKVVKKNYHVSSQTAYHITQLALQNNCGEGKIIDHIMKTYLASRSLKSF
jgi:hypothetical protein